MKNKRKKYTYEELIKHFFPQQWKDRNKVCIYCHQEIKKSEDKYAH